MDAALAPYGSQEWFDGQQPSTGSVFGLAKSVTAWGAASLASMLFLPGTGAVAPDIESRQPHLHDSGSHVVEQYRAVATQAISPQAQIEQIRKVFSPAVSDLAMALGVSRQAVYNWINGETPIPMHVDKLNDLARAGEMVVESGMPMTGWLLKRKISGGKCLLEIVRDGGSAQAAVRQLVQIVHAESAQRARMNARLAGRVSVTRSPESDFPAENDLGE